MVTHPKNHPRTTGTGVSQGSLHAPVSNVIFCQSNYSVCSLLNKPFIQHQLSPNMLNHLEAPVRAGCSALVVKLTQHLWKQTHNFPFFSTPPHSSCFAPSCHSSHQKNRFGCCWARVFFQLSRKLIRNTESCPDSGGCFFLLFKPQTCINFSCVL